MSVTAAMAVGVGETVRTRNIVIAGGGTGGHVNPALAIADAYCEAYKDARVLFIGTAQGLEARLVPKRGYEIEFVEGSRLVGGGIVAKMSGLWQLFQGILQARRLLKKHRTRLVVGVGGYASGAALLAAWTLGIKSAIHESNAVPGLTNKVLGRLVDRVYLGFEAASGAFPAGRVMVTGNPVRPEIAALQQQAPSPRPEGSSARILVVGGSQGAQFLNEQVPELLAEVSRRGISLVVTHQVGKRDPVPVTEAYQAHGMTVDVVAYIDDMASAYREADLAVTRAGSGTISELAAAGLPALLVPFPHAAGDHQAANASAFVAAEAGLMARQENWDGKKLAQWIVSLLTDNRALEKAACGARGLARIEAAKGVVQRCESLMEGRW